LEPRSTPFWFHAVTLVASLITAAVVSVVVNRLMSR
jgi:hypothetical protein